MKLKEAFQYQIKLAALQEEALAALRPINFRQESTLHKYDESGLPKENKVTVKDTVSDLKMPGATFDKLLTFSQLILDEKAKLTESISTCKRKSITDLDVLKANNIARQFLSARLKECISVKSSVINETQAFLAIDAEGKQTRFAYPSETKISYNINKNHVKALLSKLQKEIDETSLRIDSMQINDEVFYEAPFEIYETFEDIFENLMNN